MSFATINYLQGELEVEFYYHKGFAGNHEEPPEAEMIEIENIKYDNVDVADIVDWDIVENELWKHIENEKG